MPKPQTTPEPDPDQPVDADSAEQIAAPGPADATPAELAAQDPPEADVTDDVDDDPDAVPSYVGVCSNVLCQVAEVQLWKPLDEVPVMCQCGQMLDAPSDPQPTNDDGSPIPTPDAVSG